MSSCSELTAPGGIALRIEARRELPELEAFARACFLTGRFPARDGNEHSWLLDCRIGLARGDFLREIAGALEGLAGESGIRQFAGLGFGSYLLLGGLLTRRPDFRAGLLREVPKPHGRRLRVEGTLDTREPVAIVDDVLNSGRTAVTALRLLQAEGYEVPLHLALFHFTWGRGAERLAAMQVKAHALAVVRQLNKAPPGPARHKVCIWWDRLRAGSGDN